MIKTNIRRCCLSFAVILLSISFLSGCGKTTALKPEDSTANLIAESDDKANDIRDGSLLNDFQDISDKILSSGDARFFGNHPVDENFLSHIVSVYGINVLRDIVSEDNYSDAEIWFNRTGKSIHVLWDEYCASNGLYANNDGRTREIQPASTEETIIDFTGDFSFADGMATTIYMDQTGGHLNTCFSDELLSEMANADLFSVNNEFCYSRGGAPLQGKDYTFRADPTRANLLSEVGIDFVNLANNHVWDYGPQALMDTFTALDEANMPYLGAGKDLNDAKRPLYFNANGRKIAIVSATQIERSLDYTKEATEDSPGVLKTLRPDKYIKVIREAARKSDVVICLVHWGTEHNASYGMDQMMLAEAFAEAGADAIVGCHSHCLQGIENMNGVPVYYSLGNFWFATSGNMPANYATGLAQLHIKKDGSVKAYFLPCHFDNGVTSLVTESEQKANAISYIQGLSYTVNIGPDGEISNK